ncbi:MAG: ATP-dependent helicase, partial [Corynebacterium camporealensis]|nr:ATP-dependent helicase [Corynebacterium camporealensis]
MNTKRTATQDKPQLYNALANVSLSAERSFRRRLKKARSPKALAAISADIDKAIARVEGIDKRVPDIEYPDSLPVSARKDDIAEAIRDNQVVIIAGETGSGKTTQIPKICLELGRGRRGLIGHTQPRRLAARTVAERI